MASKKISNSPLNKKNVKNKDAISNIFKKQDKENDFRSPELRKYRSDAKKVLATDLTKRYSKITQSSYPDEKITQEKLTNRKDKYGAGAIDYRFERDKNNQFRFVARNKKSRKLLTWTSDIKGKSETKLRNELQKRIKTKGFNFEKHYIKEDTEPIKTVDRRKNVYDSYNTYYRFGIIIYRLKKGRKYEVIYQASDTQARSVYVSYQRIIAQLKEDILKNTGITLEEWLYLSRTEKNIYVEGGINYKRFKGKKIGDGAYKSKLDYQYQIDFESI